MQQNWNLLMNGVRFHSNWLLPPKRSSSLDSNSSPSQPTPVLLPRKMDCTRSPKPKVSVPLTSSSYFYAVYLFLSLLYCISLPLTSFVGYLARKWLKAVRKFIGKCVCIIDMDGSFDVSTNSLLGFGIGKSGSKCCRLLSFCVCKRWGTRIF